MSHIPQPVKTIGVLVGRDLIGDSLIKLPFCRALRNAFPQAEIHWVTSQAPTIFATLMRDKTKDFIDVLYDRPSWMPSADNPKPTGTAPFFDMLIDTRSRWRMAMEARRLPHRIFIAPAMRFLFSHKRPPLFQPRPQSLSNRLLQLVELAAGYKPVATGSLPVDADLLEKARQILPSGKVYVGLAPGCGSPIRMWPRAKFEQLAKAQAAKGRVPVFILGPQELDWYDNLKANVPNALFPLQEMDVWGMTALTIDHTLAVGACLTMAVANDSGAGHILAAVDCPLLSLFGPTRAAKAAPSVSYGATLSAQDFGGTSHMKAIPVDAVDAAVDAMVTKLTA